MKDYSQVSNNSLVKILLVDRTLQEVMNLDVRSIIPRYMKAQETQKKRTKSAAEVFTPSWVCNAQNNLITGAMLNNDKAFNTEGEKCWTTNPEKITFPEGMTWEDFITSNDLEITCGEAPYLASRYDTVSGERIAVPDRIGLLDRKLRVVSENTDTVAEWLRNAVKAVKSTYGYEYQEDSLWLARKNIVQDVKEHFKYRFHKPMPPAVVRIVAYIASWNIFRMDGLKMVIPNTCSPNCKGCKKKGLDGINMHDGIYALVMNWEEGGALEFREVYNHNNKD